MPVLNFLIPSKNDAPSRLASSRRAIKNAMARAFLTCLLAAAPVGLVAQTTNEPTDTGAEPQQPFSVTGGATLASQYRFRGISLSDENPAIQGTINVAHESGLYAGLWSSSLDGFGELGGADVELDLYAGYRTALGSGLTLDAGLLYYAYPGSEGGDFEFFEPYANLSGTLGPATAKIGVAFAPGQDALADNSNIYVFGDLAAAVPTTGFTLKAHIGYSKGDTPLSPSGDYVDWLVGADYVTGPLTFGVAYVDTNLSRAEAADGGAEKDIVDAALVATITASF